MPQSSVFPLSQHCDTVGPMAKIVVDFANLLDVLENPKYLQNQRSYPDTFPGDFRELQIRTTAPKLSYRPNALALDPLTLTASDLQDLLQTGKITSVEIVKMYLDQIQKHNLKGMGIRAIISTLPREKAIAFAQELDDERATKGARGPMHGIPILVKVCDLSSRGFVHATPSDNCLLRIQF
jgi:Asp-tRNA(Asn)/Glu-tRNA(Gln) amidotransferase A subunit family amidase